MTVRSRDSLKKQFADGCMPTGEQFESLISSMLHMQDEGFEKTPEDGLKVTTAAGAHALLTFFRAENARQGLWSVRYGGGDNALVLQPVPQTRVGPATVGARATSGPSAAVPLLTLTREGRIGVGQAEPAHALDVRGMVGARGRVGTYPVADPAALKADGKWHVLADNLERCSCFEVVASVGVENSGRHALLHAVALNAFHPRFSGLFGWLARRFPWLDRRFNRRRRIRSQSAWFGESCDQLELQWTGDSGGPYRLEIRTRCVYPGAPLIGVHVTQLWPVTAPSLQPAEPAARPDRPFRVPRAPDGLPPAA